MNILLKLRDRHAFKLYCYTFMPDHFHALISLGESGLKLGDICGYFKSLTTRSFWKYESGKLWQRQFFDHIIRNEKDFIDCVGYIRANPIKKGLIDNWEIWPYFGEPDLAEALG
jgi:putative transposase